MRGGRERGKKKNKNELTNKRMDEKGLRKLPHGRPIMSIKKRKIIKSAEKRRKIAAVLSRYKAIINPQL